MVLQAQFKTGIYLLPFATSLSSIRVYRFGWEGTMAKFHEQLKEKAKELHLKEKAIELKILLKKGAKIVGKKCKKGWSKQRLESPAFPLVNGSSHLLKQFLLYRFPTQWRTCKNCKGSFEPSLNHARACCFHTAHFGGETRRKFESVHTGGTMDTPDSGKVLQYWHCCGSEDPFDPGCTSGPHYSYDE
ncbi:unnamed protein product [Rhodiola kirilowii]